MCILLLVEVKW